MARFGGVFKPGEDPSPFVGAPRDGKMRVEVVNTGHMSVWVGDEQLTRARLVSINIGLLHPQQPQYGRLLLADKAFFVVLNPGEKLWSCRLLDTLHEGAIQEVDWGAEITYYIVEEPER